MHKLITRGVSRAKEQFIKYCGGSGLRSGFRIRITLQIQDPDYDPDSGSGLRSRFRIRITIQIQDPDYAPDSGSGLRSGFTEVSSLWQTFLFSRSSNLYLTFNNEIIVKSHFKSCAANNKQSIIPIVIFSTCLPFLCAGIPENTRC